MDYNISYATTEAIINTTGKNSTTIRNRTHISGLYIFGIFVAAVAIVALIVIVAVLLFKRLRLRRLRHHLMPVYNFEAGEEADYWEDQLLDHDATTTAFHNQTSVANRQLRLKVPSSPSQSPKLKFFPQPDTPGE